MQTNSGENFDKVLLKLLINFITPEIDILHQLLYDFRKVALKIKQLKIDVISPGIIISRSIEDSVSKKASKYFKDLLKVGISKFGEDETSKSIKARIITIDEEKKKKLDISNLFKKYEGFFQLAQYQNNVYNVTKSIVYPDVVESIHDYDKIYPFEEFDFETSSEEDITAATGAAYNIIKSYQMLDDIIISYSNFYKPEEQDEIINSYQKIIDDIIILSSQEGLSSNAQDPSALVL